MNLARRVYSDDSSEVNLADINRAAGRISSIVNQTEIRVLDWLAPLVKYCIVGKFENQQATGSFKLRGAANRLYGYAPGRRIVAASAGNHGLAVAEVARRLGLQATIYIPVNASVLKRERLRRGGCIVIESGADLEEATVAAKAYAKREGLSFVSPYNDPLIIAGQGTVALELLAQQPDLGTVLIPAGGGGLLAGCALAIKALSPSTKVVGVQSAGFACLKNSFHANTIQHVILAPTLADGLAVNLEYDSITFPIIQKFVDDVITVPEDSISLGAAGVLFHESQLVEPSGAIGIAAILADAIPRNLCSAKMATILTGGNVSRSSLIKIATTSTGNNSIEQLLGFVAGYSKARAVPPSAPVASVSESLPSENSLCREQLLLNEIRQIREQVSRFNKASQAWIEYLEREGLIYPTDLLSLGDKCCNSIVAGLASIVSPASPFENSDLDSLRRLSFLRGLRQAAVAIGELFAWRSSSYDQAVVGQFFDLRAQQYSGVNYDRYESLPTKELELHLSEVLLLEGLPVSLLATSSGMAAFGLIESYLIRHILEPDDTILFSSLIYFEAAQQLKALKGFKVIEKTFASEESIIEAVREHKPKVLCIDPISNSPEQQYLDVEQILVHLEGSGLLESMVVVIDGTMLSGLLPPRIFNNERSGVLYYESASKYLQLGYDATMAGYVVVPTQVREVFELLRRNGGLTLYSPSAALFPRFSRELFVGRMRALSRNARLITEIVNADVRIANRFAAYFLGSSPHPAADRVSALPYCGGVLTFSFSNPALSTRDSLDAFILCLLREARARSIPLSKGVSFGFSCPRISAAAAMSETARPFLRLNVGDADARSCKLLAGLIADVAVSFCNHYEFLESTT